MFYKNVCECFMLAVRRTPNKTAIVFENERISFGEANRRINRIANALLGLGIKSGDKVAYMLPNCAEIILIYYALQKIGAIAVPLNFRLISKEIRFLVESSDSQTLIYSSQFSDKVTESGLSNEIMTLCCGGINAPHQFELLCGNADDCEPKLFECPDAVSRIQFTGGSTGIPKGVMRTHSQDLCELVSEMTYCKIGSSCGDEVVLIQCPLEHHGGHSWYTAALSAGCTLIICAAYDPQKILEHIEKEQVTYMILLPPATYLRLCEHPGAAGRKFESVKVAQSAAGGTSAEIVSRMQALFPNAEIYYGWGQTESGLGTSLVLNSQNDEKLEKHIGSVGRPMPFVEMKIVDSNWNEVPRGTPGEAAIRSPACMKGYYKQPELTAKLMESDGWMLTGDIMYEDDDGYFYMLSRRKNIIKSGGENVFCSDVENVIRMHPSVMECVIIGVPDHRLGEAVTAVVQLRDGASLDLTELQEHCKKYLSSYKKPLHLEIVPSFDMDDAGKIRKDKLKKFIREKYIQIN